MTMPATFTQDSGADDAYDPDGDALLRNSPMLEKVCPKLEPSPSPPLAIPPPKVSSPLRTGRKSSNRRPKVPPSRGDAVLISYLDNGAHPELADEAGEHPLATSASEADEGDEVESSVGTDVSDDEDSAPLEKIGSPSIIPPAPPPSEAPGPIDLKSLAAAALTATQTQETVGSQPIEQNRGTIEPKVNMASPSGQNQVHLPPPSVLQQQPPQQQIASVGFAPSKPVLAAPGPPWTPHSPEDLLSPRPPALGQGPLRHPDLQGPTGLPTPSTGVPSPNNHEGGLPPIQMASPKSDSNGNVPLPPIRSHLGEELADHPTFTGSEYLRRSSMSLAHSPPGLPRMGPIPGTQGSPPVSPNNPYSHNLPSPAQSQHHASPYNGLPSVSGIHQRIAPEYNGISNGEPRSIDTPAAAAPAASIADRMRIDNMTNPQGTYVCRFAGCNAPPFQTQYLLNSHANVHSSARPHYCPVKNCPRGEGGKGFKRKNEMIRHGLVHDSPGYVCPFCADREHKYPRPDNLQRHVRVHHVDKDKDDPLLREVLSQRPDGPNRGRRRRGVP